MTKEIRPALSGKAINHNPSITLQAEGFKGDKSFLNLSPLKAIRCFCLDCACSSAEVSACTRDGKVSSLCPLYRFRFGHNPARSGIGNHTATIFANNPQLTEHFSDSIAVGGMQIPSEDSDGPDAEVGA